MASKLEPQVGALLFSAAMDIFEAMATNEGPSEGTQGGSETDFAGKGNSEFIALDDVFNPPRRYVTAKFFPPEATAAVRRAPRQDSELLGSLACGSTLLATGLSGQYLQCRIVDTLGKASPEFGFVLQQLDGLPLFTHAPQVQHMLDEQFEPAKTFVCSPSFPSTSSAAVRAAPTPDSELVTSLPVGSHVLATGISGSYLQFQLEDESADGGFRPVWVPRNLGNIVLFIEQSGEDSTISNQSLSVEAVMSDQSCQISQFQQWWADGHGEAAAATHAILSLVDRSVLQEVISSGANYHNCLSADRLDGLQRSVNKSRRSGLEALRRALLTKGGAKSQARAVGTVLFKEAMAIFTDPKPDKADAPAEAEAVPFVADVAAPDKLGGGSSQTELMLDEIYNPPRRFVCSDSFPPEATVAVRAFPDMEGELLTSLPYGSEILATGSRNLYLQFSLCTAAEEGSRLAWVPRVLGDLVLFVEQKDAKSTGSSPKQGSSAMSTEAVICEQNSQISQFQQWWADGHGEAAAATHAILSLIDRSVLQEVISSGANYHNCLSADRLDGLQRSVNKSRRSGLEALRRALLTKGGAKSQARAVGTVLFKEAMAIFTDPKPDKADAPAEAEAVPSVADVAAPDKLGGGSSQTELMLDEIYNPPRRFVCSDSFPPEATVAVRAFPDMEGELLTSLPYGSEILATGSRNLYLQFSLCTAAEEGSRLAWVPRVLGDLVLFVEQKDAKSTGSSPKQGSSAMSTEAVICEQNSQISQFQQWWADGHGEAAAATHAILSLIDRSVLQEVISSGANYHNCLSADRLDGLQRSVDKSRRSGLEALRRALLTKGGAKSQARAVGTVLFKEAMAIFTDPKPDKADAPAEAEAVPFVADVAAPDKLGGGSSQTELMLDEIYNPPRRFVCSDSFPPEATVAVRSGPAHETELLACLPFGVEPCRKERGTLSGWCLGEVDM